MGLKNNWEIIILYCHLDFSFKSSSRMLLHHHLLVVVNFVKEQRSVLYVPTPLPHNVHPTPFVISWNCQPNFNFVFDEWMTISSIVFIPGHRFLEGVWDNISTTRSQVVKIHTNNRWYLCHRHERVNHSKEFKNGEHSKMKTWRCLLCWYRIMIDSNTNKFYVKSQECVQVLANSCTTKCIITNVLCSQRISSK